MLDVGERVEEEVRLDLGLHQLQLRFEEVPLEPVALALRPVEARLVARVLLAHDERRHHDAAESQPERHRDQHARQPVREHLAHVAALHQARDDRAQEGTHDDREDLHDLPGNALLAHVSRHGEENHADVAHAQRAHQQVAKSVEEDPQDGAGRRGADRGDREDTAHREAFEEVCAGFQGAVSRAVVLPRAKV